LTFQCRCSPFAWCTRIIVGKKKGWCVMGKPVSREQALEVANRIGNGTLIDWSQLDADDLQRDVVGLPPKEVGRRMTECLLRGLMSMPGDLEFANAPFDPNRLIDPNRLNPRGGWSLWLGSKDGDGLGKSCTEQLPDQDKLADSLSTVDFSRVDFIRPLNRESTGESELLRVRRFGYITHGASACMGLWQDYLRNANNGQSVLTRIHRWRGITRLGFLGTVLRNVGGGRYALFLWWRSESNEWQIGCFPLNNILPEDYITVVSQPGLLGLT